MITSANMELPFSGSILNGKLLLYRYLHIENVSGNMLTRLKGGIMRDYSTKNKVLPDLYGKL